MKICMVQQHPVEAGKTPAAILRYLKLAEHFSRAREVVLIMPSAGKPRREFAGLPCYQVPTPGSRWKWFDMLCFALLLLPVLVRVARREQPDIWFVDELFVGLALPWFKLFNRRPVNYDVMGIHFYQVRKNNRNLLRHWLLGGIYGLLERLTIWGSTFLTTVNDAHREVLSRWTAKPVHVIRDAAEFLPPALADPPVLLPDWPAGSVGLTFIGKLSNHRLDDLFRELPVLLERCPALRLLIVGDGPFRNYYRRWAQRLGAVERICFHEFVPHSRLPEFSAVTDIAYSDDWSDIGFPMKVFEYMHLGLPMLVEDTPAVREVLRPDVDSFLYRGREGLAAAIIRLVEDEELRRRLAQNAAQQAPLHTWERRVAEFLELYRQYTGESRDE